MLALHLEEAGHRGRQAEIVGIGRVDSPDERLRHALERLAAETAGDERSETFVRPLRSAGQNEIESHPQLAGPGEEPGRQQRPELRRRQQQKTVGQRVQPAAVHDKGAAVLVAGADEPRCQPDAFAELQRRRFLGNEGVGAGLDDEAVGTLGADRATRAATRFPDGEIERHMTLAAELDQPVRRRHAGDAGADHGDANGRSGLPGCHRAFT
jgi:hypothetical protein